MNYLVQVGLLDEINIFRSSGGRRFPRDCQVVCRTDRGLEVGKVITSTDSVVDGSSNVILRRMTKDDRLIVERLNRFKERAFAACERLLADYNLPAILVDTEHLFDGNSVYFYFLGDIPEDIEGLTERLADVYDAKVRFRQFADKLANGCGPGCGTVDSKCGDEHGCKSCAIVGSCRKSSAK
ncbi:MAG TPA: PSP1 domain-containing protein [Pirellulaceae bacterium]|nr:PSP1 domain-containing protein [Pirellulaceae bacterium]HMO91461.1 PSP1 domain-containing protein [Pirellulaceae bacterium]HMP69462.1 PSP1 domain-containing protein [Pirellulaceae bacterium]